MIDEKIKQTREMLKTHTAYTDEEIEKIIKIMIENEKNQS